MEKLKSILKSKRVQVAILALAAAIAAELGFDISGLISTLPTT